MKAHIIFLMIGLAMLVGCVPTLNLVYNEGDVVYDEALVGEWQQQNSADVWQLTKRDDQSYWLSFTDRQGRSARFVAHLAEVQGTRFLDLVPELADNDMPGLYAFHMLPIHSVYLVKQTDGNVVIAAIDYNWLDKYLEAHPEEVPYASFGTRKLLTGSTSQLQSFLAGHKDRFTAEIVYTRGAEAVPAD